MFCSKCGNELNEGAAFCPKCGEKTSSKMENMVSKQLTQGFADNTGNRKKIIIAAGIAVVIALVLMIVVFGGSDPENKLKKELPGTWVATFNNGYECRLHIDEDAKVCSALLIDHNLGDIYCEIMYTGEVDYFLIDHNQIYLNNTSNPDNPDHDFEIETIAVNYSYNDNSKELMLSSLLLGDYLSSPPKLEFSKSDIDYYDGLNSENRVYDPLLVL